jgi:hypothetical protein
MPAFAELEIRGSFSVSLVRIFIGTDPGLPAA